MKYVLEHYEFQPFRPLLLYEEREYGEFLDIKIFIIIVNFTEQFIYCRCVYNGKRCVIMSHFYRHMC